MQKPNPVKKTVEYCNMLGEAKCDQFNYDPGGDAICKKYKRGLSIERPNGAALGHGYRRPEWCTDDTFVRVKISPAMSYEGEEYCVLGNRMCSHLFYEDSYFRCRITLEKLQMSSVYSRPDECRKLEVE